MLLFFPALSSFGADAWAGPTPVGSRPEKLVLERRAEPREGAYSILVPKGWIVEGGIFWVHPDQAGGPANSIEKKNDLTLKSDAQGTVMLRLYPDVFRADTMKSTVGGLFPYGSVYAGMQSAPVPSAQRYIADGLKAVRPAAKRFEVIEQRSLDGLADGFRKHNARILPGVPLSFDAGFASVTYQEAGTSYVERAMVVIEDRGAAFAGQWTNRSTVSARAPKDRISEWDPVFRTMLASIRLNPSWLASELRGQLERAGIVGKTLDELRKLDAEIADHRRRTNEAIQHDMYLTLTDQTELVDPYTKEIVTAPSDYTRYFVNRSGEVLMTKDETYDPARDPELSGSDWQRMTPKR